MSNTVNPAQVKNQVEPLLDRVKKVITKQEVIIGIATTVALTVLLGLGAHFGFLPNMPWQDVLIALGGTALVLIPVGASAMLRLRQKPLHVISSKRAHEEPAKVGLQYDTTRRLLTEKQGDDESLKALLLRTTKKQHPGYQVTIDTLKQELGNGVWKDDSLARWDINGNIKLEERQRWVGEVVNHYQIKLEAPLRVSQDVNRTGYIHVAEVINESKGTQHVWLDGPTKEAQSDA